MKGTDRRRARTSLGPVLVLAAVGVLWALVVPVSLLDALGSIRFDPAAAWQDEATPAADVWRGRAQGAALQATALAAVLPVAGALLALRGRRRVVAAVFGGLAALGMAAGIGLYALALPDDRPAAPEQEVGLVVCPVDGPREPRCR